MAESDWHGRVQNDNNFRRKIFEAVVMQCLWIIVMRSFGMGARQQALDVRQTIIDYWDAIGREGDEAREYRHNETYPKISIPS